MAEVIHTIKGNEYLYVHTREGDKVVCRYVGPVGKGGKVRAAQHGGGTPLEVTQQTPNQTKEGKTINTKKDNSSMGQEKPEEKSTMKQIGDKQAAGYDFKFFISEGEKFEIVTKVNNKSVRIERFDVIKGQKLVPVKKLQLKADGKPVTYIAVPDEVVIATEKAKASYDDKNVKLEHVGKEVETGINWYALDRKITPTKWDEVKNQFVYKRGDESLGRGLGTVDGWVTLNPQEVEKRLGKKS